MHKDLLKEAICDFKTDMGITAIRFMNIIEKIALKPYNISMISGRIMLVIVHFKKISQSEIAEYVLTSNSNLSQRLNFLEKKGLIVRSFAGDKNDKRKVMISPTKKGEELFWEIFEKVADIKEKILNNFTKEELEGHAKFGLKMSKILDKFEYSKQ